MEIKEKIKQYYKGMGITVNNEDLQKIMKDNKRANDIMRMCKQEEMDSMNYILGKPKDNKVFTEFELGAMSKVDLFNKKLVKVCKIIWDNRNDEKRLDSFLKELKGGAN